MKVKVRRVNVPYTFYDRMMRRWSILCNMLYDNWLWYIDYYWHDILELRERSKEIIRARPLREICKTDSIKRMLFKVRYMDNNYTKEFDSFEKASLMAKNLKGTVMYKMHETWKDGMSYEVKEIKGRELVVVNDKK